MKYDRNSYGDRYENIAIVNQGEIGISSSESKSPILATSGLGVCISLSGWSPEQKIGFLTHWPCKKSVRNTFPVLNDILLNSSNEPTDFEVRIVGCEKPFSEEMIKYGKERLEQVKQLVSEQNWKLIEEDSWDVPGRFLDPNRNKIQKDLENKSYARSIALDCRTGQALAYKSTNFFLRRWTNRNTVFDYR